MKIIAIDGPSGVGKSTLAKKLSNHFNIPYLDTGKMYRAFSYLCLEKKIDLLNEKEVERVLPEYKEVFPSLSFEILNSEETGRGASIVAQYKKVREKMVYLQREFGIKNGAVVEGRDTTTVVFPETPFKFYIYAREEIRVWRRYRQIDGNWGKIALDIEERDKRDREREISPLKFSPSSIPVDTSNLNENEVFKLFIKILKKMGFK
ncbi:MAG: (d)CMP kinase [Thermoanaerobaculia bacterium]